MARGRWRQWFAIQVRKYLEFPQPCTPGFSSAALPSSHSNSISSKTELEGAVTQDLGLPQTWPFLCGPSIHKLGLTVYQGSFTSNVHKKKFLPPPAPNTHLKVPPKS